MRSDPQPELAVTVFISGSGSNLQALIDHQAHYGYRIIQVISNRSDAYGLERAHRAGIPSQTVDHQQFTERRAFEQALLQALTPEPQLILLAGFMRVLSSEFLGKAPCPLLNIHPSLLPKFKGLNTHRRALASRETEHGCSVHRVTAELDSGPLLAQCRVQVEAKDTPETLAQRVLQQEHRLYPWVVGMLAQKRLELHPSSSTLDGAPLGPQGYQLTNGSDPLHEACC